jgi:hypothetical protein
MDSPHPTPSSGALAPLERAFADVYDERDADGELLRGAICSFTDEMKAAGWTAEHVIIAVKKTASRQGVTSRAQSRSRREPSSGVVDVLAQAVRWCIDHYYAEHLKPDGTSPGGVRSHS